jgi:hypothetical protein
MAKSLDFVRLCSGAAWMAGSSPAMTTGDRWQASDRSLPTANALSAELRPATTAAANVRATGRRPRIEFPPDSQERLAMEAKAP